MQTVVLAAGEGTRMRPLTADRPKPLLPVADRPLVAHVLDAAAAAGASRFVIVVGYGADAVRRAIGREYAGVPVEYAVQERQRGTADAVATARPLLDDAPFAVVNGDALFPGDALGPLFDSELTPAVAACLVDDPTNYGVLDLRDAHVSGVVEKPADPPSEVVNAGAYAFPAQALDWLDVPESERGERELTDVLARCCGEFAVTPVRVERWLDVGRPWELLEANEWVVGDCGHDVRGAVRANVSVRGPVVIEEGATVESGTVIEGPALVRTGATVGPNARVRPATVIGPDATVGTAVEVKNSVLMDGATIPHHAYVGDSILGPSVNFGAGTKVANLRHDGEDVKLTVCGERVSTGRRKFGVVAGPRAKTGINASLNAGVTLSADSTVMPGEAVFRDR